MAACGGTTDPGTGATDDPQLPPEGAAAVDAWIAKGYYKAWHCEPAKHDARSPSPHGQNRICSNTLLSGHTTGEYPVDASSVKEIYNAAGQIGGYAVGTHIKAGAGGETWYWYEKVPLDSMAPHDANGVVADGLGDTGTAKSICVGCHAGAGSDPMHSGHDMVYTQVK
jgi:hypothetical protein